MNNFNSKNRTRQDFKQEFERLLRLAGAVSRKTRGGRLPPKYQQILEKGDSDE